MKLFHDSKKQYRLFAALALFMLVPVFFSYAQSAEDIRQKINQNNENIAALEREIAGYQSQLNAIGKEKSSLASSLAALDINRKKLIASTNVTENKIAATNLKISNLGTEIVS